MSAKRPPSRRGVSSADAALFREAVGPVRPIQASPPPPTPQPPQEPRQARADEEAAVREARAPSAREAALRAEMALAFRRDHVPPRVLQRLGRGHYRIEDELDLHGMSTVQARASLRRFLAETVAAGHRCVRVVHGKGLGSTAGVAVLKPRVAEWLAQRTDVLAYASAPPAQGGTGAVLVLLAPRGG